MPVTPSSFKIRFPEFSTIGDDRIALFISDAEILLNETTWGTKYDLGIAYLTAHYLSISTITENGNYLSTGPRTSQAVDGTSISYASSSSYNIDDVFFASTIYGQRYISLRDSLQIGAYSVTGT